MGGGRRGLNPSPATRGRVACQDAVTARDGDGDDSLAWEGVAGSGVAGRGSPTQRSTVGTPAWTIARCWHTRWPARRSYCRAEAATVTQESSCLTALKD